jgi:hypothetical protein
LSDSLYGAAAFRQKVSDIEARILASASANPTEGWSAPALKELQVVNLYVSLR